MKFKKVAETLKNIDLGKLKMWQTRLATYISMVNFAMIFYLFIAENKWFEWYIWTFIIMLSVLVIVVFDTVNVMPKQLRYSFLKNPEWLKMKRNQKRIMDKLLIGESYE